MPAQRHPLARPGFVGLALAVVVAAAVGVAALLRQPARPIIGLITKTETNPFFVKMAEGARSSARARDVELLTAAGSADGDHATQARALQEMVGRGARVILITPNDAKAIVPLIAAARAKGVLVIALDSPTDPPTAVDSVFATNNFEAGRLVGRYARAALAAKSPRVVTIDLFPGHPVGIQRHNGFLDGMGLAKADAGTAQPLQPPELVCSGDSFGHRDKGRQAMEACLARSREIDLVYTINEPAAAGARAALDAAGLAQVPIVSIDGGCQGVRDVAAGAIAATAQQYPLSMASEGVAAGADYARAGTKPPAFVDTGATLITDRPVRGVDGKNSRFGLLSCWG